MSFLSEILKKRSSLNHARTTVTTLEGKTCVEEMLDGEHFSVELGESQLCPGFVIDTKPDLQVAEILPSSLYLGSQDVTQEMEIVKKYKISHILSIGVRINQLPGMSNLCYSFIPALDLPEENIDTMLEKSLSLMQDVISKGGCLFVHCNAGVSRAPTVVMAYLMTYEGMSFCQARDLVKVRRPSSNPNRGFIKQLLDLEKKIKDKKCLTV